ncbi:MAG TPA: M23 family metallopeptidase [Oligoflexia bacterium]|nr:M23 family metallopeptidase [Oligoflexia bacterium]HMP48340.1 M23 family metallopeptidase [Oligoflexia bacterium]
MNSSKIKNRYQKSAIGSDQGSSIDSSFIRVLFVPFLSGLLFFLTGLGAGFGAFFMVSGLIGDFSFKDRASLANSMFSSSELTSKTNHHPWISDKEVLALNADAIGDRAIESGLSDVFALERVSLRDDGRGGVNYPEYSILQSGVHDTSRKDLLIQQIKRESEDIAVKGVHIAAMDRLERLISRTPIGAPVLGRLTSRYGKRSSPFLSHGRDFHTGLDIAVDEATPIFASADGKITLAESKGAYGKTVIIEHPSGLETLYAHLSRINVKSGDHVCRGQQIGMVGTTGRSTGPHLHYEVRENGIPIDPYPFVELASVLRFAK